MNRASSRRAVGRTAGFLLALAVAALSGCIPEGESGTCRYQRIDVTFFGPVSASRTVSSAVECQALCVDESRSRCQFTPDQTAITGP